jgi:hypothetical protein
MAVRLQNKQPPVKPHYRRQGTDRNDRSTQFGSFLVAFWRRATWTCVPSARVADAARYSLSEPASRRHPSFTIDTKKRRVGQWHCHIHQAGNSARGAHDRHQPLAARNRPTPITAFKCFQINMLRYIRIYSIIPSVRDKGRVAGRLREPGSTQKPGSRMQKGEWNTANPRPGRFTTDSLERRSSNQRGIRHNRTQRSQSGEPQPKELNHGCTLIDTDKRHPSIRVHPRPSAVPLPLRRKSCRKCAISAYKWYGLNG